MRKRNFGDAISKFFKLGRDLNQRDTIAVKHTVSGLLKLLYPNEKYDKDAVRRCLEYALIPTKMRRPRRGDICTEGLAQNQAHLLPPAHQIDSKCYLPLRSSERTRRRAACTMAVSALSRRSCSRYSRTASGCAAFQRSGNNSSVLAVPRSMCVSTLSKYKPTSRSILSALATSEIRLALRIPARRLPMNNQFLRPIAKQGLL